MHTIAIPDEPRRDLRRAADRKFVGVGSSTLSFSPLIALQHVTDWVTIRL
jgi:hypothetical protein